MARRLPRHVAIIMDGNGRWAERRGLPRAAGHRKGVEAVRRTVRAAIELGIHYLTHLQLLVRELVAAGDEIDDLMGLMKRFIRRDLAELHQNGVRIRVIGERERVDPELLPLIDEAVALTSDNTALNLVIAFNYGSRAEIAKAARRLAERVAQGAIKPQDITPERSAAALDTHGHARSRSAHPHQRRAAAVELPALAVGLYRVRVSRCLLARLRSRAARAGDRRVPPAQPPVRRRRSAIDRGQTS